VPQAVPSSEWTCRCGQTYRLSLAPLGSEREGPEQLVLLPEATTLSPFQLRVLGLVAAGMTDREASRALQVSLDRVRYAVREVITRLSARSRAEAVFIATTKGILATVSGQDASAGRA
jgi:DNA-binding NarL/FixJ family response regulator